MYLVKGYCAGILLFTGSVSENELDEYLDERKRDLKNGNYTITFAMGVTQTAKELCVDVYENETMRFRLDLSRAYKC